MTNLQSELYSAFDSDPTPIVQFLQWVAASYSLPHPLRILDIGCGPGRLLRPLANLGWQVVGMEPDAAFYTHAAEIAAQLDNVAVEQGGFSDLNQTEAFHLIAAVNSSFSHLLTGAERAEAFQRIVRALVPGGIVFVDVGNFLWILKHYREPTEQRKASHGWEIRLQRQHQMDFHDATFTTIEQYTVRARNQTDHHLTLRHVYAMTSLPELAHLLHVAGFGELRTYNRYTARQSERLTGARIMLSAQKPMEGVMPNKSFEPTPLCGP